MVIRSASAWHGWWPAVSMLKTGTPAWAASCSTSSSGPVRMPIAATWRLRTSAVSRTDSPRESWSSFSPRTIGKPPISWMPAWKDTRVRVEGLWKSSATLWPSSAREASGSRLSASARSRIRRRSSAVSSAPVSRWRGKWGTVRRRCACSPGISSTAGPSRRRDDRCSASSPRRWPGGSGTWRCCRSARRGGRRRSGAVAVAEYDVALTSRNCLLPARRWAAERWPDLMRSGGGSSNAIVVRGGERIAARARRRLRLWPERRVVHAVRLEPSGVWVANLHAQVHSQARAEADLALAARSVLGWAGREAPVVLGGDLNQRHPSAEGFAVAGGHGVDHVLLRGLEAEGRAQTPDRGPLSDHAPVAIVVRRHPG